MFRIDNQSRIPVFEQIVHQAEEYVRTGILKPGDKLPSIREGCFISKDISDVIKSAAIKRLPEFEKFAKELLDSGIDEKDLIKAIKNLTSK